MNENFIISTMKLLKEHRNNALKEVNGNVCNVKYIGDITKNEENKEKLAIYLIIEQYKKDDEIIEVERYYSQDLQNGDIKFMGGNNINDGIETIYLSNNYIEDDKQRQYLQKEINQISKEGILDLNYQEKLEQVAKELGISVEDVKAMVEVELEQEKQNEAEEQNEYEEQNKNLSKQEDKLTKKETEELTQNSGKQEVNIDTMYDNKNTLRNELGLTQEYKSVMVVDSDKLRQIGGKDNNTPLAFVAIDKNGNAQIIDSLELDTEGGAMPTKESIKIDNDGTARQDINTLSRYKIAGTNNTLSVERGLHGEMKVYHGQKTKEENRAVEFQLETRSIKPTSREMKELQKPNQGEYHIDDIDNEISGHTKSGEKEVDGLENIDGNPLTATHIHDGDENSHEIIKSWAKEFKNKNQDIDEAFEELEEIQDYIERYLKRHKTANKEDVERDLELDAQMYLEHMKKR